MMKQVKTFQILLNNQKQKTRIRATYGPHENMTPNNELKLLYKTVPEQIEIIAQEKYQHVHIVEDLGVRATNKQYQKDQGSSKD